MVLGRVGSGFVIAALAIAQMNCGGSDESSSNSGGKSGGGTGGSGATGGSGGTGASSGGGGTGATSGSGGTGATGGSGGTGATGGAAGSTGNCETTGAAGSTGKTCGGKGGSQCDVGEYCHFPDKSCGVADQIGECQVPPTCNGTCSPVCGCDGLSYSNRCTANEQGVDAIDDKSCVPGNGGEAAACFGDADCQTGFKCCRSCGAIGCPQSCAQIPAGGKCPALP